jgi:hypothetical protein
MVPIHGASALPSGISPLHLPALWQSQDEGEYQRFIGMVVGSLGPVLFRSVSFRFVPLCILCFEAHHPDDEL